jgi:hypothetical protein
MKDEELLERILRSVKEGRLTCADAHAIAEETGATLARIGKLCDGATPRIKIAACQLGCF